MRGFIGTAIAMFTILFLFFACIDRALGADLKSFSWEAGKYVGDTYDPFLEFENLEEDEEGYGETPKYYLMVDMNFDISKKGGLTIYNDQRVHGMATEVFRKVYYEYEMGFNYRGLHLFWQHRSTHALDMIGPSHFPLRNIISICYSFIGDDGCRR